MACPCRKRKDRLAAAKRVTRATGEAAVQQNDAQQFAPAVWSGKPTNKGNKDG